MSLLLAILPLILATSVAVRLFLEGHEPRSYGIVATLATGVAAAGAILHIGLSGRWEDAWILPVIVLAAGALAVGPGVLDDLRDGRPPVSYDTLSVAMLVIAAATIAGGVAKALARQHGA